MEIERKFGRLQEFDNRSRAFPIRTLLEEKPLRSYGWRCTLRLDQGQSSSCVGHAWAHELAGLPVEEKNVAEDVAMRIYHTAQTLDDYPGENYDGTSVLGGVKAVQQLFPHAIDEYRWAFGLQDVLQALAYIGPVVLGINWYSGMCYPDAHGYIAVTGSLQGGHAILANEVNMMRRIVRLHNSWGAGWGNQGNCFVSFDELDRLLKEGGEACVPLKRKLVPIK